MSEMDDGPTRVSVRRELYLWLYRRWPERLQHFLYHRNGTGSAFCRRCWQ